MIASLELRPPHAIDQVVVIQGAEHALEQGRPLLGRLTGRQRSNGGEGKLVSPCPVLCEQSRSACIHDRPLLLALTLVRRGCRGIDPRGATVPAAAMACDQGRRVWQDRHAATTHWRR